MRPRFLIILIASLLFFSCGENTSSNTEQTSIKAITATGVELNNGKKISFPNLSEGSSVIFLVRPGEYSRVGERNMASLTSNGKEYAEKLKSLFQNAGLQQIMGIATRYANETLQPTTDLFGLNLLTYNNSDYGAFLEYVFETRKGNRFLVLETLERIPELLRTLTPGELFDSYPPGVYNKLYLIIGKERTQVEVHELYF